MSVRLSCPICHLSVDSTVLECPNCGAVLGDLQAQVYCRACGQALPADAQFCNFCGAPMMSAAAPPEDAQESLPRQRLLLPLLGVMGAVMLVFGLLLMVFFVQKNDNFSLSGLSARPSSTPALERLTPGGQWTTSQPEEIITPLAEASAVAPTLPVPGSTAHPFAGQRMAYASAGEQNAGRSLFLRCLDDACAPQQLTFGTSQFGDNYPTFAADGRRLAFTRCYLNRSDGCDLMLLDLQSGALTTVLSGHKVMRPKGCGLDSSPYRDWVVFEDRRKNGNDYQDSDSALSMVNIFTGEFRSLTTSLSDWMPAWSADCSHIFFSRYDAADVSGLLAGLMTLEVASGKVTAFTDTAGFSPPAQLSPVCSPDGLWVAYRQVTDTNGDGRYRGADDRVAVGLLPLRAGQAAVWQQSFSVASLSWSPDSRWLLVSSNTNQARILDLQGSTLVVLGEDIWHPVWAPR